MKNSSLILIAIFLISAGSSLQPLKAQDKTKEEQEKELRIQEEIDKQKKAMTEPKKVQVEIEKFIEEREIEGDDGMKEVRVKVEKANNIDGDLRGFSNRRDNRSYSFEEPFSFSSPDITFYRHSAGDGENSSWDFSKSVKESNYSRDYVIDVEKSAKAVVMSVTGDCKSGEIRIRIVMPNGKTYSDIVVDEFGKLNWRKSFNISEEENKDKSGEWKYEIKALKATGFFKISLQTF